MLKKVCRWGLAWSLLVGSWLLGSVLTVDLATPATASAAAVADGYTSVTATRVADTRPGTPTYGSPGVAKSYYADGSDIRIPVAGRAGVPKNASAVAVNLTATQSQTTGYLTAYPCDTKVPNTSNVNLQPGNTVANLVITKIGEDGDICIFNRGFTHFIVDINGYVPAAGTPILTRPTRIGDTRPDNPKYGSPTIPKRVTTDGGTLRIPVAGRAGVPNDAAAVAINLTATQSQTSGYLTAYACDTRTPKTSNVNLQPGNTVANLVISKIGADGDICIFSRGITHLIIDINGYVPREATPILITPTRAGDTRPDTPTYGSPNVPKRVTTDGGTLQMPVADRAGVPKDAAAVVINLTATQSATPGYLTVYACDAKQPTASNINLKPGNTVANLVITKVSADGSVCIFSRGVTHLIVDVYGYVPATPTPTPGCTIAGTEVDTSLSKIECEALIAFYDSTGGPNWTNKSGWNTSTDPCTWYGIFCFRDQLVTIELINNNLDGELPAEVGDFPHLDTLTLVKNRITKIPPEIAKLTNLTVLDVGNNELPAIPAEVGKLKNLRLLSAWGNEITNLPTELGDLTNLGFLDLRRNRIGTIPSELGNLPRLSSVYLSQNRISKIPPEIGNATTLETFSAWGNQITAIPPEIANLTALVWLDLDINRIRTIPPEIGLLNELQVLRLADNEIVAIPDTIGYLVNLSELNLANNQISGDVSEAFVPLIASGISIVDLRNNNCPTASYPEVADWLDANSPGWRECSTT